MTLEKKLELRGEKRGREEGRKEGEEKGRKEGEEIGEKRKAIETAKKMKNDGVEINIIMKYTGLSKEEIEEL